MERGQLESAGASYPYTHLQGLYGIPFGLTMFLVAASNLEDRPAPWALGALALMALAALAGVYLYYRRTYGMVTPTRSRQTRYAVATAAGLAVFVAADQLGRAVLGRPPREGFSTTLAAWALGMLVFYAASSGLRAYHVVIWGAALGAGLLPVWGVGVDRDALAYIPIGAGVMVAGVFDHLHLVRAFRSYEGLQLEDSNAGA